MKYLRYLDDHMIPKLEKTYQTLKVETGLVELWPCERTATLSLAHTMSLWHCGTVAL